MNQAELDQAVIDGTVMRVGDHYFFANDVAKTLLPRIKEITVEE